MPSNRPRLTPYRFLCISALLVYLVVKSTLAYLQQSEALLTTADLVYGVVAGGVLYWIGLYDTGRETSYHEHAGDFWVRVQLWLFRTDLIESARLTLWRRQTSSLTSTDLAGSGPPISNVAVYDALSQLEMPDTPPHYFEHLGTEHNSSLQQDYVGYP